MSRASRRRRRRARRAAEEEDETVRRCPYPACQAGCANEWIHHACYAARRNRTAPPAKRQRRDKPDEEEEEKKQPPAERYVGVYVDASGALVPVSQREVLRAVAEEGVNQQ